MANCYSNQHSLALDKMSVSSECFYQPRVQSDFDADAESLDQQLGKCIAFSVHMIMLLNSASIPLHLSPPPSLPPSLPPFLLNLDPANAFQISHADKSFHVFTSSSADKANWLANLNKHISRAAQLGERLMLYTRIYIMLLI